MNARHGQRTLIVAGVLLFATTALSAGSRRELAQDFAPRGATELLFEMDVGELVVEAVDSDRIEVSLELRCRSRSATCERHMDRVEIVEERRAERLHIGFDGLSKMSSNRMEIDAVVRVPRQLELIVEMGIGELEINGVERDLFVDMGIGEARLWLDESAVRSIFLDAGIGESSLYGAAANAHSSRPFLVGSELDWAEGSGRAEIVVELGIGEISVHLD